MGRKSKNDKRDLYDQHKTIMTYYRFKTFTTSYYFPNLNESQKYMYGLYSAYGGKLSKLYWNLFQRWRIVRVLTTVKEKNPGFPYQLIKEADGTDCLMSFNMGSPGVEQKISILGYDNQKQSPFFAKFSQKPAAKELTKNEIDIYKALKDTQLTPQLLDCKVSEEYVYLKAEYIKGERPKSKKVTPEILRMCLELKNYHLTTERSDGNGLQLALSHGDFCPWNVLMYENQMKLIDWELAKDRPLGFDLFTYICQVSLLFKPEDELLQVIDKHNALIKKYFTACGIKDYLPYLKSFATEKASYEKNKSNDKGFEKYHQLEIILS